MTEYAASQASREGKNCSKKTRSLASIPPTRAALANNAKRAVFQDGFVWPQTPPSKGDDSLKAVSGYTSLDNSSTSERYML